MTHHPVLDGTTGLTSVYVTVGEELVEMENLKSKTVILYEKDMRIHPDQKFVIYELRQQRALQSLKQVTKNLAT